MKKSGPVKNIDEEVIAGFGEEWSRYDQSALSGEELEEIFNAYFSLFPWESLPENAIGFDLGCGSGRWATFVAPRVGILHCIDPSLEALEVAKRNLKGYANCEFHMAGSDDMPLSDLSADFGYSLGVLHHVVDTHTAVKACTAKLKPGAPFLIYLYYAFDNRPQWFITLWRVTDIIRRVISRLPYSLRHFLSQVIAFLIYLPLARFARLMDKRGINVNYFPLSYYRHRSLYVMRNDALDRFGTKVERRYPREEIQQIMEKAGLENIKFREAAPYWCAVGTKMCVE